MSRDYSEQAPTLSPECDFAKGEVYQMLLEF